MWSLFPFLIISLTCGKKLGVTHASSHVVDRKDLLLLGKDRQQEQFQEHLRKTKFIQKVAGVHHVRKLTDKRNNVGSFKEQLYCDICEVTVKVIQEALKKGSSKEEVIALADHVCLLFRIEDSLVCDGLSSEFSAEFIYVMEHLVLSPKEACGVIVGDSCSVPFNPERMWNVTFPHVPKPPVKPPVVPKPGSPVLRILHLSDFHVDYLYKEGSNTECGEPLCCRSPNGPPEPGQKGAGKWGDYRNCDIPRRTLVNLFQHLHTIQDQFDIVYFTGDIPPHDIWNQTRGNQLSALDDVTNLFLKYIPHKPVFHSLGNHESAPVNSFPPPFVKGNNSINWLYRALVKSWSHWLPSNTSNNINKGAYYTVSPFPGFRIISLNMNYCNNMNWWLLLNTTDPAGQLQWLIQTLQKSEDSGEKVHILGHISPGSADCMKAFDWNYFKIINRYENTVAGQYFGHVHNDLFQVMYDNVTFKRPIGVVFIPGSITTFPSLNPGYRIYQVDGSYKGSSWMALNYQNHFLNLTEANISDNPKWELEYDAKKSLGMPSVYPKDWHDLVFRMKNNDTLFQQYYRYTFKGYDGGHCNASCKKTVLCGLQTARSHDPNPIPCQDL